MKTQSSTLLSQLSTTEVETLTSEVKEILAVGFHSQAQNKIFSAAKLWNIQRNRRTVSTRRYFA